MAEETPHAPPSKVRFSLSADERRVLGVLIEKALATPEYYPMTLKALVAGCNQRNNRDPVVTLDEAQVGDALASLQKHALVMAVKADTGWATRWRHEVDRQLGLGTREQAVLAELLLRGPQTEGELRTRAGRMASLADVESVQETLERLQGAVPRLATRLSPEGAVRGVRWAHALYQDDEMALLSTGEGAARAHEPVASAAVPRSAASLQLDELASRLRALEDRVARLEGELGVGGVQPPA